MPVFSLDLLIIEDVSSSVMNSDYKKMKHFILNIVRGLDISQNGNNVASLSFAKTAKVGFHLNSYYNKTQVGFHLNSYYNKTQVGFHLNSYYNKTQVGFHLNSYYNKKQVLPAIESDHGEGGGSNISSALQLSVSDVFMYHNGDRADADNIVLLFTDGIFKDESRLQQDLEALKSRAKIYVVRVGSVVSNSTLAEMASSPKHLLKLGDSSTQSVISSVLTTCGIQQAQ